MSGPIPLHQSSFELEDLRNLDAPFQLQLGSLPEHPDTNQDSVLQSWLKKDQQTSSASLSVPQTLQVKERSVLPALPWADTLPKTLEPPKPLPSKFESDDAAGQRLPPEAMDRASRCWEDWYHLREAQNRSSSRSSTRSRPRVTRLVTDVDCMSTNKDDEALVLMEGLVHATEEAPIDPSVAEGSGSSKYIIQRPAPSYTFSSVFSSLISTVTAGVSSELFQWDAKRIVYRWTGAMLQHERAEAYLSTVEKMRQEKRYASRNKGKGKETASDTDDGLDEEQDYPQFEEWYGHERIAGFSSPASQAAISNLLEMGTAMRRLEERIADIRQARTAQTLVPESSALCHAIEVVLEWVAGWLRAFEPDARKDGQGFLGLESGFKEVNSLLTALLDLLGCPLSRKPPFKSSFRLNDTSSVLTHIFAHYTSASVSQASPFTQQTLLWLLEKASHGWREDIAAWVGWPGLPERTSNFAVGEDAQRYSSAGPSGPSSRRSNVGQQGTDGWHRMEPWSGAQVEWGIDSRGEEDVGYRLTPAKLPAFISIAKARSLLEAGRALRLLRKAADPNHPLLKALDNADESDALDLPSWLNSETTHSARHRQLLTRIREHQHAIAAWRRRKAPERSSEAGHKDSIGFPASSTASVQKTTAKVSADASDPMDLMRRMQAPLPLQSDSLERGLREEMRGSSDLAEYSDWIADVAPAVPSANNESPVSKRHVRSSMERPAQRLFELLLQWSKLINAALISVFFRDLGFPAYLDTCRQFLLLGSASFSDSMQELLFADGISDDDAPQVLRSGQSPAAQPGEGLSRLLASERWPPPAGQISTRFNAAVVKAVLHLREAHEASRQSQGQLGRDALRDLDERLSFALVDPSVSKIRGHFHSKWEEPSSIDAMDWLTLSFHPPSLIAPLLTHHAQLSYQRILNFLLRLMRVKAVLRGLHLRVVKLRTHLGLAGELDQSALFSFQSRAQHFLAALGSYVEHVAIEDIWLNFRMRLEQLQKDVEAQDDSFLLHEDEEAGGAGGGADDGEASASNFGASNLDDTERGGEGDRRSHASTPSAHLKDVFSIAQYHERVLDRIITACFQKQRQSTISSAINELFDAILAFSATLAKFEQEGSEEARARVLAKAYKLGNRFEARLSLLVRGLRIIEQSGRRSSGARAFNLAAAAVSATASSAKPAGGHTRTSSTHGQGNSFLPAGALEEIEKQEEEAEEDLRLLEKESSARRSSSESELAAQLLARLDLTGRYV